MSQSIASQPLVIDVRPIPKPQRHPLIFDALEQLASGESLVVHNDHNPIPLRGQVEAIFGPQFSWSYLEEGPEEFRLQFTREAAAPPGWSRTEYQLQIAVPQKMAATSTTAPKPETMRVNLAKQCGTSSHSGPQWAHESEDLDMTLLSWGNGKRIEAHVNNEVDAVLLGVEGSGVVTVNGEDHALSPGVLLLIPKSCERAIQSTSERFSYLSVHKRRRGLMPTVNGQPLSSVSQGVQKL